VVTGDNASATPGRPRPRTRQRPRPHLAATHPPPLVRVVERETPRNHHRRTRRLARVRTPRRPTRPLTYHHRGPVRHRRGGTAGDRRGLGIPV